MSEGRATVGAQQEDFAGWAIVELMGHRRLAGKVSPATICGTPMVRLDIPTEDHYVTQYYSGSSLYAVTPVSEEIARQVAKGCQPAPVSPWELRALNPAPSQGYESGYTVDGADDQGEIPY